MPLLALGTYTIRTEDPYKPFVGTEPVQFTYYPLRTGLWVLGIVLGIGVAIYLYKCRWFKRLFVFLWRFATSSRFLPFAPAAVGWVCLVLGLWDDSAIAVFGGLPLLSVTGTLLAWRWGRPRSGLAAFLLAFVASAVAMIPNLLGMIFIPDWLTWKAVSTIGLLLAALLALCLLLIRLCIRERVTTPRLLGGLILSLGAAFVAAVSVAGLEEVPWQGAVPLVLGAWALAALPFAALARWHKWARTAVVGTQTTPAPGESPSTASTLSGAKE